MGDLKYLSLTYSEGTSIFPLINGEVNMTQFKNVMEVFKLLEKSNCRKCGEKTCIAFAASVFMGQKTLSLCPSVSPTMGDDITLAEKRDTPLEDDFNRRLEKLKKELTRLNFAERAEATAASYEGGKLSFKIMGKTFSIDTEGNVYSAIHINSWVYVVALNYLINCQGDRITGNWVPLRELPGGQDWYRLFGQQCEKPLKKTADTYPDLFEDLIAMFSGREIVSEFQSDVALILHPLPMVPMLICYWRPEDGMGSSLNLFFDDSAAGNLGMDGLYLLGTGFARMLERLVQQHGFNSIEHSR